MAAARLAGARTRARAALIASIGVTIALSVALLCALAAWISLDTRTALRDAFADGSSFAQVQTRVADDVAGQDAAAAELFDGLFGDAAIIERIDVGEGDSARVAWRITPDASRLDVDRLERLVGGVEVLPERFRESDAAVQGSEDSGDLGEALGTANVGVGAAASITPVSLALVGVLAWFAVFELARLLGASRGREAALLRARGQSRGQSLGLTAAESAGVAVVSTVLGFASAAGVFAVRDGMPGVRAVIDAWPIAAVALGVLALTLGLQSARAAERAGSARAGAGRVARAATLGAGVLVVLAAAVSVWQLVATRGAAPDDPWRVLVTALAPTLGVAAVAVLAVLLFGPAAAAIAAASAGRRGVSPVYPARQVARRIVAFSTAIALVAIAVSGAALTASYVGTWRAASVDSARLTAGAELRAEVDALTPGRIAPAGDVAGVTRAAPALTAPLVVGDGSASLVAVPADAIEDVLLPVAGVVDPAALAKALAAEPTSAPLPDGATGIRLTAHVLTSDPDPGAMLSGGAWVIDATGTPARVVLDRGATVKNEGPGWTLTVEGDLPEGTAPWRLLAVDVIRALAFQGVNAAVSGAEIAALEGSTSTLIDVDPEASVVLQGWGREGIPEAVIWSGAGLAPPPTPAVVSETLARELGLDIGGTVDVRFDGSGRTAALSVTGIAPAIPGAASENAVLVAYDTLSQNFLDATPQPGGAPTVPLPNGVWAAGDAASAEALGAALEASVQTPTDSASTITTALVAAWWASAAGGAVLAGVALIALLTALAAQRAGEVLVLRALGIAPRRQARMRLVEASVVALLAALLGAAGGLLLSWFVVPVMVGAAVPGSDVVATSGALAVDPWPIVVALLVLAAALGIASALATAAMHRQGASTRLEEAAP